MAGAPSRSEYPAPFMKKDSFKSLREGFKEASRAELQPIDEDELQRKELERLLGTATDFDRKEIIQKAINALDVVDADSTAAPVANNFIQSLHPSVHANLFSRVPVDTVRGRPVSAQKRRPSNAGLLGSIPENRSIVHEGLGKTTEIELMLDDIADICASSYDPKYPPKNLFLKSRNSNPGSPNKNGSIKPGRFWIPTGLSPQFLAIHLHMSWNIRKIEVKCIGVDEIVLRIESGDLGKRSVVSCNLHKIDDKLFTFNAAGDTESQEITGNKILLTLRGCPTESFQIVNAIHIHVLPTG